MISLGFDGLLAMYENTVPAALTMLEDGLLVSLLINVSPVIVCKTEFAKGK